MPSPSRAVRVRARSEAGDTTEVTDTEFRSALHHTQGVTKFIPNFIEERKMKHPVDILGHLLAEIATLELQAKVIKDALKTNGAGAYEGDEFRATVSVSERGTLDMAAVREKLSPQFISAHTKTTEVVIVKVVARTAKNVIAVAA